MKVDAHGIPAPEGQGRLKPNYAVYRDVHFTITGGARCNLCIYWITELAVLRKRGP